MIKRRYIPFIFPVMALMLFSCREVYYPDELNSGKSIPVIQGRIAQDEVPTVVLSWAMNYGSSSPDYIKGAKVVVSDDKGNSVTLAESTPGHYIDATGAMYGTAGTAYQLHVIMDDGEEFASSVVTMPEKPNIDSLYAQPGRKLISGYNQNDKPYSTTYEGLYISTSLSADKDSTQFYRFSTSALQESTCIIYPGSPSSAAMFLWDVIDMDNAYSVDFTVKSGNRQVRPEHQIGFLRYFYDPSLGSRMYSAPVIVGWVITFKVFAISSEVYNYYQSIGDQLSSSDQMFAPVPSQVKSNIHCTTHPELPVVGVFDATSVNIRYKAFRWVSQDTYKYIELNSFPSDIVRGSRINFPPSFWISFN